MRSTARTWTAPSSRATVSCKALKPSSKASTSPPVNSRHSTARPALQAAIAVTQGVKLDPHYWLEQKTFTCLTDTACNETKEYVAQLKSTGMQF